MKAVDCTIVHLNIQNVLNFDSLGQDNKSVVPFEYNPFYELQLILKLTFSTPIGFLKVN